MEDKIKELILAKRQQIKQLEEQIKILQQEIAELRFILESK